MPMDSTSTAKQQDFNPPEKSKTASKYKHAFQPRSYFYTLIMGLLAHS